jgi:hypothetical protein
MLEIWPLAFQRRNKYLRLIKFEKSIVPEPCNQCRLNLALRKGFIMKFGKPATIGPQY